ncbi:MAG: MBL fold metallo-hydrolase, partial [Pseudomonadota bacterium]
VVRNSDLAFLIDCGMTIKETTRRLNDLAMAPEDLAGIVVTHEHGDHLSGVAPFARRYQLPVWMTHGTWRRARDKRFPEVNYFSAAQPFSIGSFLLRPFAVPHDAAEACQLMISHGDLNLAVLTDLGAVTPHVIESIQGANGLILECNHDEEMLRDGPYPPPLQARVGGAYGHLSNRQAASLIRDIDTNALEFILLAHLSERNNTPDLALEAIAAELPDGVARLRVLAAETCSVWFRVNGQPSVQQEKSDQSLSLST